MYSNADIYRAEKDNLNPIANKYLPFSKYLEHRMVYMDNIVKAHYLYDIDPELTTSGFDWKAYLYNQPVYFSPSSSPPYSLDSFPYSNALFWSGINTNLDIIMPLYTLQNLTTITNSDNTDITIHGKIPDRLNLFNFELSSSGIDYPYYSIDYRREGSQSSSKRIYYFSSDDIAGYQTFDSLSIHTSGAYIDNKDKYAVFNVDGLFNNRSYNSIFDPYTSGLKLLNSREHILNNKNYISFDGTSGDLHDQRLMRVSSANSGQIPIDNVHKKFEEQVDIFKSQFYIKTFQSEMPFELKKGYDKWKVSDEDDQYILRDDMYKPEDMVPKMPNISSISRKYYDGIKTLDFHLIKQGNTFEEYENNPYKIFDVNKNYEDDILYKHPISWNRNDYIRIYRYSKYDTFLSGYYYKISGDKGTILANNVQDPEVNNDYDLYGSIYGIQILGANRQIFSGEFNPFSIGNTCYYTEYINGYINVNQVTDSENYGINQIVDYNIDSTETFHQEKYNTYIPLTVIPLSLKALSLYSGECDYGTGYHKTVKLNQIDHDRYLEKHSQPLSNGHFALTTQSGEDIYNYRQEVAAKFNYIDKKEGKIVPYSDLLSDKKYSIYNIFGFGANNVGDLIFESTYKEHAEVKISMNDFEDVMPIGGHLNKSESTSFFYNPDRPPNAGLPPYDFSIWDPVIEPLGSFGSYLIPVASMDYIILNTHNNFLFQSNKNILFGDGPHSIQLLDKTYPFKVNESKGSIIRMEHVSPGTFTRRKSFYIYYDNGLKVITREEAVEIGERDFIYIANPFTYTIKNFRIKKTLLDYLLNYPSLGYTNFNLYYDLLQPDFYAQVNRNIDETLWTNIPHLNIGHIWFGNIYITDDFRIRVRVNNDPILENNMLQRYISSFGYKDKPSTIEYDYIINTGSKYALFDYVVPPAPDIPYKVLFYPYEGMVERVGPNDPVINETMKLAQPSAYMAGQVRSYGADINLVDKMLELLEGLDAEKDPVNFVYGFVSVEDSFKESVVKSIEEENYTILGEFPQEIDGDTLRGKYDIKSIIEKNEGYDLIYFAIVPTKKMEKITPKELYVKSSEKTIEQDSYSYSVDNTKVQHHSEYDGIVTNSRTDREFELRFPFYYYKRGYGEGHIGKWNPWIESDKTLETDSSRRLDMIMQAREYLSDGKYIGKIVNGKLTRDIEEEQHYLNYPQEDLDELIDSTNNKFIQKEIMYANNTGFFKIERSDPNQFNKLIELE